MRKKTLGELINIAQADSSFLSAALALGAIYQRIRPWLSSRAGIANAPAGMREAWSVASAAYSAEADRLKALCPRSLDWQATCALGDFRPGMPS